MTATTTWRVAGLALTSAATGLGCLLYLGSDQRAHEDPHLALQQLDLLYLDQPAPAAVAALVEGGPALVVVCDGCTAPAVTGARVVTTDDPAVARALALVRPDGTTGTGYGMLDGAGRLRYRTYDPGVAQHRAEIQVLLDGLP